MCTLGLFRCSLKKGTIELDLHVTLSCLHCDNSKNGLGSLHVITSVKRQYT